MKPTTSLLACAVLAVIPSLSHATLLSYWNFNNVSPVYNSGTGTLGSLSTTAAPAFGEQYTQTSNATPGTLASNTSNSTVFNGAAIKIDFSNIAPSSAFTVNGKAPAGYTAQNTTGGAGGYGAFAGSSVTAVGTDVAGQSLLLLNNTANSTGLNNRYLTFSLSSAGYDTLSLAYASRVTNSVTASQVWSYSTNGTTFSPLATISPTANATFLAQTLNLSTLSGGALNNKSAFYLRMTYTTPNAGGSQAFDNIQLTGSAIPEPTLLAPLCGAVALLMRRKRR